MVRCLFMLSRLMMLSGFIMMLRGVRVMFGRHLMMLVNFLSHGDGLGRTV